MVYYCESREQSQHPKLLRKTTFSLPKNTCTFEKSAGILILFFCFILILPYRENQYCNLAHLHVYSCGYGEFGDALIKVLISFRVASLQDTNAESSGTTLCAEGFL